jgi:hypothetical protein
VRGKWIEAERVRKEPPKGPSQNVSALESNWTSKKKDAARGSGILGISGDFDVSADVLGRPGTLLDGGPCRDRTYDQLIKSQLLYQLS